MKREPFVSIVILNYNGRRFLKECLSTVFRTKYSKFEVILVDNSSVDDSIDFVRKEFGENKQLKIITNRKNLGFGPANNVGFKHARGDYIVFLNNDTSVEPEWLAALVEALEKDRTIGLAQSLLLNMDGKTVQNAGWLIGDYFILSYSIRPTNEGYSDKLHDVFEVSVATGAAMIARRGFLQEMGPFDPKYLYYYDDDYLSFRTWLAGKRVVTVSSSKVCHLGRGTEHAHNIVFAVRHQTIDTISLVIDTYWKRADLTKALFILALY